MTMNMSEYLPFGCWI